MRICTSKVECITLPYRARSRLQARTLDDSLHKIIKLELTATSGGKGTVPSQEQLHGKEKLQVSLPCFDVST